jgi:hypothetical protein
MRIKFEKLFRAFGIWTYLLLIRSPLPLLVSKKSINVENLILNLSPGISLQAWYWYER